MASNRSRQSRRASSIVIPALPQGAVKPGFEPGCGDCAKATAAAARCGAVPPATPRAAALTSIAVVTSDGVEVTQAIQNMAHDVPLVADKRTIVRVYLSTTATASMLVQGLLKLRRLAPSGPWQFVRSLGPAHVDPAENGQLRVKRENESKSLNFLVPPELCAAGRVEVGLAMVWQTPAVTFLVPPLNAKRSITFAATPPLRVRILGVRYKSGNPAQSFEPSALDYTLIRSWLGRAYPVARTDWSQAVVNGPQAWPFDASAINAFVRGIRMGDVAGGTDARTHYFGLVSDANGANFMRGLASGIPGTADPSTVASGPTGSDTWGWDVDGSYGDWYTGHELGHTFGRFHAEFCGASGGAPYPFVNGQLSNADGAFVGFDTGDPAHGLPIKALPGTIWHDVMTYCSSQWISSFTYTGIRDRLVLEDALPAGAMPVAAGRSRRTRGRKLSATPTTHVVGTLNLTRGTGSLRHVTAYATLPSGGELLPASKAATAARRSSSGPAAITLRLFAGGRKAPQEFAATFIPDACTNPGDDVTGTVDALIPAPPDAARLELVLNGHVVDTYEAGTMPRAVRDIRSISAPTRARRRGVAAPADQGEADAVITWQETGVPKADTRARSAETRGRTYVVQVSADDGQTWQTAGFGLSEPQTSIDRRLFGSADTIKVRVIASDGFRSVTTEKTLKVADL
jgi:hypothetical protein